MPAPLISVKNLKKHYSTKNGLKEALRGVSFEIYPGEVLSLLGVNGAGKTTLSSLISGLHPPTSGDILWNGSSIYRDIAAYRRTIGFCPQKPNLDKILTLEENLRFAGRFFGLPAHEVEQRQDELMEQFGLREYARSTASTLSGGYRQRYLIARTLMHAPKLVILDEPTVGLDPHIRHQLWEQILRLKKEGISILLTTHYLDEAETLSDRVCMIDGGLIRTIDTPANLLHGHQQKNLEEVFLKLMRENEESV